MFKVHLKNSLSNIFLLCQNERVGTMWTPDFESYESKRLPASIILSLSPWVKLFNRTQPWSSILNRQSASMRGIKAC